MSRFPVNILFESIEFAIPATFKNKAGVAKDIFVVFDDSFSITQIGETGYVNENPVALCSAKDVKGICKGSRLDGTRGRRHVAQADATRLEEVNSHAGGG